MVQKMCWLSSLAERLGLECKQWHAAFVLGLVREAVQMVDLDEQVSGSSSTRSMQNLLDAKAAFEKERKKTLEPPVVPAVTPSLPKEGYIGQNSEAEERQGCCRGGGDRQGHGQARR